MPTQEQRSPRVAQASRMVAVQAGCTVAEAVVLMETRAVSTHTTLEQIAIAVVDREIRFGS
jgi:hypothetical protein